MLPNPSFKRSANGLGRGAVLVIIALGTQAPSLRRPLGSIVRNPKRASASRTAHASPVWHLACKALVPIIRLADLATHRRSRVSSTVGW